MKLALPRVHGHAQCWFLPAPLSRSRPPLAGCAAGVEFLLLHLPLLA